MHRLTRLPYQLDHRMNHPSLFRHHPAVARGSVALAVFIQRQPPVSSSKSNRFPLVHIRCRLCGKPCPWRSWACHRAARLDRSNIPASYTSGTLIMETAFDHAIVSRSSGRANHQPDAIFVGGYNALATGTSTTRAMSSISLDRTDTRSLILDVPLIGNEELVGSHVPFPGSPVRAMRFAPP